jgi:hypothetical protein
MLGPKYKPYLSYSTSDGMGYNSGAGVSGAYSFTGNAAISLFNHFAKGGNVSDIKFENGEARWWTDIEHEYEGLLGTFNIWRTSPYEYDTEMHKISQDLRAYAGYGFTLSKMLQAGYEHASLYGKPPAYTTTSVYFEKSILGKKVLSLKLPFRQINANSALKYAKIAKGTAIGLGAVGAVIGAIDIYNNGFTTSNTLDTTMSLLAATPTGVTQGIAGAYFTANFITKLLTGKDIGQHLDDNGYNLGEFINNQIK